MAKNPKFEMTFGQCVYSGISQELDRAINDLSEDRTAELEYIVAKYNDEFIISGAYLSEKLEKYKQALKSRAV